MSTFHAPKFPPQSVDDVFLYDTDEVVAGYREYRPSDPTPGDNHSPSYRWGWANRRADMTLETDGYESFRREYINLTKVMQ